MQKNPISEPDLTQVFGQPGILLIGTHGQNEADRPLTSYLLCNSGGDFDGQLTALELFKMPIESDVVVLSACYSGLADRSPLPGDDLFGLQRAILQSGAKSIISGLWDVYDVTAPELIKSTMTHFNGGQTISRSLAEAQRDFLKKRKEAGPSDPWVHPYFWAVYSDDSAHRAARTELLRSLSEEKESLERIIAERALSELARDGVDAQLDDITPEDLMGRLPSQVALVQLVRTERWQPTKQGATNIVKKTARNRCLSSL